METRKLEAEVTTHLPPTPIPSVEAYGSGTHALCWDIWGPFWVWAFDRLLSLSLNIRG